MVVQRQTDGWPAGVSDQDKELIVEVVREILSMEGRAMTTRELALTVKARTGWACPLWDTQDAAIERTCVQLGAEHRWSLGA